MFTESKSNAALALLSFKKNNPNTGSLGHIGSACITFENEKTISGQKSHNTDTISSFENYIVEQNKTS